MIVCQAPSQSSAHPVRELYVPCDLASLLACAHFVHNQHMARSDTTRALGLSQQLQTQPGDVFLQNRMALHCAFPNESASTRCPCNPPPSFSWEVPAEHTILLGTDVLMPWCHAVRLCALSLLFHVPTIIGPRMTIQWGFHRRAAVYGKTTVTRGYVAQGTDDQVRRSWVCRYALCCELARQVCT